MMDKRVQLSVALGWLPEACRTLGRTAERRSIVSGNDVRFLAIGSLGYNSRRYDKPRENDRIPKSDPKKYQGILDAKDWKNPQLIVRPTGIEVIGITPVGSGLPVDSILDVLGHLPDSAWPYGLVVAVSNIGLRTSKNENAPIHANRVKLLRILKRNGIAVELWPSA